PGGTSAISTADEYGYEAKPDVLGNALKASSTRTSSTLSGTIVPNGLTTTAYFEYGLDPSEVRGGGVQQYPFRTASQAFGTDFSDTTVTENAVGLQPGATYHARLIATNSAGTTVGPDETFTTQSPPPPAPPVEGRSVNLAPVSGQVFIELPGRHTFIPLTAAVQVPIGATIDATHGKVALTSARTRRRHGRTQTARFYDGEFKVGQHR